MKTKPPRKKMSNEETNNNFREIAEAFENGKQVFTADGLNWEVMRIKGGMAKLRRVFFKDINDKIGRVGQTHIPVENLHTK